MTGSRWEHQVRKRVTQKEGKTREEAEQKHWKDSDLVVYNPRTVMCLRKMDNHNGLKQELLSNPPMSSLGPKKHSPSMTKLQMYTFSPRQTHLAKKNYIWHANTHDEASVAIRSNTSIICIHTPKTYLYSNEITL